MSKLTKAERELLALISPGRPINVEQAADLMGKPVSPVSRTRQRLLDAGLIWQWNEFLEPLRITKAGRSALGEQPEVKS